MIIYRVVADVYLPQIQVIRTRDRNSQIIVELWPTSKANDEEAISASTVLIEGTKSDEVVTRLWPSILCTIRLLHISSNSSPPKEMLHLYALLCIFRRSTSLYLVDRPDYTVHNDLHTHHL